jgi:hypothetical protein
MRSRVSHPFAASALNIAVTSLLGATGTISNSTRSDQIAAHCWRRVTSSASISWKLARAVRIEAALAARQLHAKAGDLREVMTYTAEVRVVEQAVRICSQRCLFAGKGSVSTSERTGAYPRVTIRAFADCHSSPALIVRWTACWLPLYDLDGHHPNARARGEGAGCPLTGAAPTGQYQCVHNN